MEHLSRHSHISFFLGGWGMIWFESNFDWKIEQPKKLSSPVFSITVSSGVILQLAILLIKPPHFLGTSSGGVWGEVRLCSYMSLPQTKTERTITCFVTYMEYMVLQAGLIHTCRRAIFSLLAQVKLLGSLWAFLLQKPAQMLFSVLIRSGKWEWEAVKL